MVVTLLTDYGSGSEHVGVLHALVARSAPSTRVLDLAHDILPGDVRSGALTLARVVAHCPVGVHVAVVDPGVGTERRGVALRDVDGRIFVGPDNGLLTEAVAPESVVRAVDLAEYRGCPRGSGSVTFDGRDVFLPAAIDLVTGTNLTALGDSVDPASLVRLAPPESEVSGGYLMSEVVGVDRFGNVQLGLGSDSLTSADLPPGTPVWVTRPDGERRAAVIARTYADVTAGDLAVLIDSHGHLSVVINRGDAAAFVGGSGVRVEIARRSATPAEDDATA